MKSFGETRCMIPQKPKTKRKKETKEVQRDTSHELLDWLQEYRENLVEESTSEGRRGDLMERSAETSSSSHELPLEQRAHVEPGSGRHSVYTHFPKDPNCEMCLKTIMTRLLAEDSLTQSCT